MGKTLEVLRELNNIFSNDYSEKEKLTRLIEDLAYVKRLLDKLFNVIKRYEKQGENIDQQINFLKQLIKFKNLIEENITKSIQNHNIVLIIDDYISAIREDYKIIRNFVQTLEDINSKIEKKGSKSKDKSKIGNLIIRGVEEKMPNFIYFGQTNSDDLEKRLGIVKNFYGHFIKYILYVREATGNNFDDNQYRLKLESLQSKLLKTEPIDIKHYFSTMLLKLACDRGYSTEILLQKLVENPMVHRSVANSSEFYCRELIDIFQKLKDPKINTNDKKCIQSLSTLIYKLNEEQFSKLHDEIFKDELLINLVLKPFYDKGIELYSIAYKSITIPSTPGSDQFKPTSVKRLEKLQRKFNRLFTIILSRKNYLLNIFRDTIIDEKNANGTFILLGDIYGKRISSLDFSDDILNVKYCFNYYFFKSLRYQDLDDVSDLSIFYKLLFYIHTSNDDTNIRIDQNVKDADKAEEQKHKVPILELKKHFLRVFNDDNRADLCDLIEIFKIMMNIQSFEYRLNSTRFILSELENKHNDIENISIKIKALQKILDDVRDESEIYLRLAQSFNIHLLKDVVEDKNDTLSKLCSCNWNLNLFIEKLYDLNKKFDINQDLTPGFSIPYYLSAKLADDPRYSRHSKDYNEENNKIVMSILFKVFTCSAMKDKEEFLKNKNALNKEFVHLFESINRLIKFYDIESSNNIQNELENIYDDTDSEILSNIREKFRTIFQELRDISIGYILDGFSGMNEERLEERNKFARTIIDNFINYKLTHVIRIVKSSSEDDIKTTFYAIMRRKEGSFLNEWVENTSKLGDKIYFLYCYHKYSEKEFDQWFRELNPNTSNLTYERIMNNNRLAVKREIADNVKAFESINIKYLQHNQVGALALIYDFLQDVEKSKGNLFIKIGTGQGKSLTIAETARKIIQLNRENHRQKSQIFIITCYDHLAKRDYENYLNYYKYFDIRPMYCSSLSSTKDFYDKDIIYVDLGTYFTLLRKEGYNALVESNSISIPNYSNTVLIMDEFDSLILDSDEIFQFVYYFDLKLKGQIENVNTKEAIRKLFDETFIKQFESQCDGVFDRWCEKILKEKQKEEGVTATYQDGLGKVTSSAEPFLNYLSKTGKASFVHFYLDPLTFYSKFKQVIGFSGSITESGMTKFKTLFENKRSIYYEIPPFFGLANLKNNRTFENSPGKIFQNRYDFSKAIREEIRLRYQQQPILIFADSFKQENEEQSDYDYIYDKLVEAQETFLKDSTIIKILQESDINKNIHQIGKLGSITIATRIIGRGADIKVDKNIPKGLHLILTYYPKRENIYTQMLGRTARQDEKGSYSEIVRFEKNFVEVNEVKVDQWRKKIHDTTEYFYDNIGMKSKSGHVGVTWPLFSCLIQYLHRDEMQNHDLNSFIKKNIL